MSDIRVSGAPRRRMALRGLAAQPARHMTDVHHHVAPDSWLANGDAGAQDAVFNPRQMRGVLFDNAEALLAPHRVTS